MPELFPRRQFFLNLSQRRYRYTIEGDNPPWRPVGVYDDGRKVYIEFSPGIVQGEMPPLFVIGPDGNSEIVNYRTYRNVLIVDRLFAAAELRLGGELSAKGPNHQKRREAVVTDKQTTGAGGPGSTSPKSAAEIAQLTAPASRTSARDSPVA